MPPHAAIIDSTIDTANNHFIELDCTDGVDSTSSSSSSRPQASAQPLSPPPRHERRREVTFATINKIHPIETLDELEESTDLNDIWYDEEDFDRIKAECRSAVDRYLFDLEDDNCDDEDDEDDDDNDESYIRGLERFISDEERSRRRQNKLHAVAIVLEEQEFQVEEGIWDPDTLADAYFYYTRDDQQDALITGFQDEEEALLCK